VTDERPKRRLRGLLVLSLALLLAALFESVRVGAGWAWPDLPPARRTPGGLVQ
jgi:hypothetical protein